MSERIFTIEMIDMDLADLGTDEFLGLTPTYLRSILLELKRCYELIDWLTEIFPKSWCIECGDFLGKGKLEPLKSNQIDECDHT